MNNASEYISFSDKPADESSSFLQAKLHRDLAELDNISARFATFLPEFRPEKFVEREKSPPLTSNFTNIEPLMNFMNQELPTFANTMRFVEAQPPRTRSDDPIPSKGSAEPLVIDEPRIPPFESARQPPTVAVHQQTGPETTIIDSFDETAAPVDHSIDLQSSHSSEQGNDRWGEYDDLDDYPYSEDSVDIGPEPRNIGGDRIDMPNSLPLQPSILDDFDLDIAAKPAASLKQSYHIDLFSEFLGGSQPTRIEVERHAPRIPEFFPRPEALRDAMTNILSPKPNAATVEDTAGGPKSSRSGISLRASQQVGEHDKCANSLTNSRKLSGYQRSSLVGFNELR